MLQSEELLLDNSLIRSERNNNNHMQICKYSFIVFRVLHLLNRAKQCLTLQLPGLHFVKNRQVWQESQNWKCSVGDVYKDYGCITKLSVDAECRTFTVSTAVYFLGIIGLVMRPDRCKCVLLYTAVSLPGASRRWFFTGKKEGKLWLGRRGESPC